MFEYTYQNNSMSCRDTDKKREVIDGNHDLSQEFSESYGRRDIYPKDITWLRLEFSLEHQEEFKEFCRDKLDEEIVR